MCVLCTVGLLDINGTDKSQLQDGTEHMGAEEDPSTGAYMVGIVGS